MLAFIFLLIFSIKMHRFFVVCVNVMNAPQLMVGHKICACIIVSFVHLNSGSVTPQGFFKAMHLCPLLHCNMAYAVAVQ